MSRRTNPRLTRLLLDLWQVNPFRLCGYESFCTYDYGYAR